MDKLKMHSPDLIQQNIDKIADLFPTVVTESRDDDGNVVRAIDFDLLRQELTDHVVEGPQERYQLDWPGKREALFAANAPIAKTLRPVREASVNFDTTKNLFIEGDNLDALKLLQESYLGKVKLIYIDPPYNTGNDFIYDDDFSATTAEYLRRSAQIDEGGARLSTNSESNGRFHSDWLSMVLPRLKLARNLLRQDGVIFVSIDDNEVDNLKRVCSEVFGSKNFVAQIIWQKVYSPKNSARWFSEDHDYILVFARDKEQWRPEPLPRTPEMDARYTNPDDDPRGPWKSVDMSARNPYAAGVYPVITPSGREIKGPPTGRYWGISRGKFQELQADNRIWWGADGNNAPAVKRFLSEVDAGRTPQTLWFYDEVGHTQDAKKSLLRYVPFEHTENVLNSVKPVALLQRIIRLAGKPQDGDIVLDFFGGSATTAHAVLQQNLEDGGKRQFINVTIAEPLPLPETGFASIFEMGLTRVRNLAKEIRSSGQSVEELDLGFRVLRVDSSNMTDVHQRPDEVGQEQLGMYEETIKPDRTSMDLLFQVLIDWGLDLSSSVAVNHVDGHEILRVDDDALVACFGVSVSSAVVHALADRQPLRAVFADAAFDSDDSRINAEQIFAEVSPHTDVKVI